MHRRLMLLLCASLISTAVHAQAPTGKVTVVTSYSKDVTDPVKKAFEAAVPGMTLEVQNRNTNAGVKYLEETKANNQVDLFWASAPDAFEVLKGKKPAAEIHAEGAPAFRKRSGSYPINDPEGFYFGFAASGYGIMWNERYAKANKLPDPKEWQDLAKPVYFDHVSIAAPSRSGTTHLTIETDAAGRGLGQGLGARSRRWPAISATSPSARSACRRRSIPARSATASSSTSSPSRRRPSGFPVKFVYPTVTTIVPANVAIVANAPNKAGAEAFVEFLLSPAGQQILFEPEHPPPSGQSRRLRQGARRLSQSVQGSAPELDGQVRRRRIGGAQQRRRRAVRPADHVSAGFAEGGDQGDPRRRSSAGEEGQRRRRARWSRRRAS